MLAKLNMVYSKSLKFHLTHLNVQKRQNFLPLYSSAKECCEEALIRPENCETNAFCVQCVNSNGWQLVSLLARALLGRWEFLSRADLKNNYSMVVVCSFLCSCVFLLLFGSGTKPMKDISAYRSVAVRPTLLWRRHIALWYIASAVGS